MIPSLARSLAAVHEQRRALETQIEALLEAHPLSKVLTSIPGRRGQDRRVPVRIRRPARSRLPHLLRQMPSPRQDSHPGPSPPRSPPHQRAVRHAPRRHLLRTKNPTPRLTKDIEAPPESHRHLLRTRPNSRHPAARPPSPTTRGRPGTRLPQQECHSDRHRSRSTVEELRARQPRPLKRPHLQLRVRRTIPPLGCLRLTVVTMLNQVAVLSDIHGALPALDAVLAEPQVRAADRIVLTGDITAGPQPTQVIDLLTSLGDRVAWISGNADRELNPRSDRPLGCRTAPRGPPRPSRLVAAIALPARARPREGPVLPCHPP